MTLFVKFTDISFNPTTQKMQCKIQNVGKTPEKSIQKNRKFSKMSIFSIQIKTQQTVFIHA